jgi:hypothetical protein
MKKTILLLACFICLVQNLYAQAAVSYFPVTSYIGVSTNPYRILWADLRLQTNTFAGYSDFELSPKINLKRTDMVRIYTGIGINLNIAYGSYNSQYINGYFLSSGVMVSPFSKVKGLSFIFELSPYINQKLSDGMMRTSLGIGWQFRKRSKRK